MRHCIATVLLLLWVSSTLAADSEKLLAELMQRASANTNMAGTFQQTKHIEGMPLALKSSGSFRYSREKGIIWHTTTPLDSVLHISAAGLRYNSGESVPGSSVLAETLLGLFTGDLSNLTQYFSSKASGKPLDWQIVLVPQSAAIAEQVAKITMAGAHFTRRISIVDSNGDATEISLRTEQENGAEAAQE